MSKEIIEQKDDPVKPVRTVTTMNTMVDAVAAVRVLAKAESEVIIRRVPIHDHVIADVIPPSLKATKEVVDEILRLGVRLWIQDRLHFQSCRGNPFLKANMDVLKPMMCHIHTSTPKPCTECASALHDEERITVL